MYKLLTIKDEVRVPPTKFNTEIKDALKESLEESLEGTMNSDVGVFLSVTEILNTDEGKIIPEDGAIYYPSEFKVLTFIPEINEIVFGEVVDITEFGAFIRIGPIDALAHVSQIMDDKIAYDSKNAIFVGKKSGNKLKEGDIVKARIVSVSLGKGRSKISLTMRQPTLGSIEWIEKEKRLKKKKEKKTKK